MERPYHLTGKWYVFRSGGRSEIQGFFCLLVGLVLPIQASRAMFTTQLHQAGSTKSKVWVKPSPPKNHCNSDLTSSLLKTPSCLPWVRTVEHTSLPQQISLRKLHKAETTDYRLYHRLYGIVIWEGEGELEATEVAACNGKCKHCNLAAGCPGSYGMNTCGWLFILIQLLLWTENQLHSKYDKDLEQSVPLPIINLKKHHTALSDDRS